MAIAAGYRTNVAAKLVDGPLRGRSHLPRTVGYRDPPHRLPRRPYTAVITALASGQRSPVFLMGTSWSRHFWYVRLPTRSEAPWAGVVRCEASDNLPADQVTVLADVTACLLPPLAEID